MNNQTYLIKEQTLTDIADAIREKTQDEEPILVSDFASEIENIPSGGGSDISEYISGTIEGKSSDSAPYPWMNAIHKLPPLTNSGTSCKYMFKYFQGTNIDLSNIDTTNVTTMEDMFRGCSSLTTLNFSNFNTLKVTTTKNMFNGCSSLTELDLSSFHTNPVKFDTVQYMFSGCSALRKIDIRNIDFSNQYMSWMQWLVGVPTDCLIIVKDDTQKTLVQQNASGYTNIKTVAEYEAE